MPTTKRSTTATLAPSKKSASAHPARATSAHKTTTHKSTSSSARTVAAPTSLPADASLRSSLKDLRGRLV